MRDLLLRGRGADIGARAPEWQLRLAGAVLGLALVQIAVVLGLWNATGVSHTAARVVGMLSGAVLAPTRVGCVLWLATGGLGALLLFVTYTPVVQPLVGQFIRRDDLMAPAAASDPASAVVVFSGGVTSEGRLTGAALDRLLSGLAEAKHRQIGTLALSVVRDEPGAIGASSERDQRELVSLFAPDLDVRFVYDVHSTRDEALAFSAMARTHGWRRVLAVTSPTHTARACSALEVAGLAVHCVPSVPRDYAVSRLDRPENRRLAFADVLYETAARTLYLARGWMR